MESTEEPEGSEEHPQSWRSGEDDGPRPLSNALLPQGPGCDQHLRQDLRQNTSPQLPRGPYIPARQMEEPWGPVEKRSGVLPSIPMLPAVPKSARRGRMKAEPKEKRKGGGVQRRLPHLNKEEPSS